MTDEDFDKAVKHYKESYSAQHYPYAVAYDLTFVGGNLDGITVVQCTPQVNKKHADEFVAALMDMSGKKYRNVYGDFRVVKG